MHIQHQVDQGPAQQGAVPPEGDESPAGDLPPPLQVQQAQALADFPVGFDLEVRLLDLAAGPDHHVALLPTALRHAGMRHVREHHEELIQLGTEFLIPGFQLFYPPGNILHALKEFGCILAGPFFHGDVIGFDVTLVLQLIAGLKVLEHLLVQGEQLIQIQPGLPRFQSAPNNVRIIPNQSFVQHN